jgi:hypothetical protein
MENTTKQTTDLILNSDGTATWTFHEEGDSSGQTYSGIFVFRTLLTPTQTLAAGRTYRELLGNDVSNATESERFMSFALSQLIHRVIKAPPFWRTESMIAGDIADLNIISMALDKAISSEILYKESVKKRKMDALEKAAKAVQELQAAQTAKPTEKKE